MRCFFTCINVTRKISTNIHSLAFKLGYIAVRTHIFLDSCCSNRKNILKFGIFMSLLNRLKSKRSFTMSASYFGEIGAISLKLKLLQYPSNSNACAVCIDHMDETQLSNKARCYKILFVTRTRSICKILARQIWLITTSQSKSYTYYIILLVG